MTTSSITSTVSQSRITRDTQQVYQRWGSGVDGTINISTATTLTTDKAYENLNVATGVTLNANGYVVRVRNRLNLFGTISNSATGATPGGTGTVGGGGAPNVAGLSFALGGAGGANTVTAPGAGVNAIIKDTNINNPRIFDLVDAASMFSGGSGGNSGASGGGGGIVVVFANTISGTGAIRADGGNAVANGGGGGAVIVYTTSAQGSITLSAAAGTPNGSAGNTSWIQV